MLDGVSAVRDDDEEDVAAIGNGGHEERSQRDHAGEVASALYRLRRRRDRLFGGLFFSEPSWDLLLELLAAEKSGSPVSVKTACLATAVPNTTALRCLRQLEDCGIVYREPDPSDRRRTNIRLTDSCAGMMQSLLFELRQLLAGPSADPRPGAASSRAGPPILHASLDGDSHFRRIDSNDRKWSSNEAISAKKGVEMQELNDFEIEMVDGGINASGVLIGTLAGIVGAGLTVAGLGTPISIGGAALAVEGASMVAISLAQ